MIDWEKWIYRKQIIRAGYSIFEHTILRGQFFWQAPSRAYFCLFCTRISNLPLYWADLSYSSSNVFTSFKKGSTLKPSVAMTCEFVLSQPSTFFQQCRLYNFPERFLVVTRGMFSRHFPKSVARSDHPPLADIMKMLLLW